MFAAEPPVLGRRALRAAVGLVAIGATATALAQLNVQSLPLSSGSTARLRGVSAASETVVWTSGSGSTVLRSTDGGGTWVALTPPVAERLDFRDIDTVSPDIAFLLSIGEGPLSRIFKTTDAGATWALQFANAEPKGFFDAMAFADATHGVVVSDSIDGAFYVLLTTDGNQWSRVPTAALPPAQANEGFFAASGSNVTMRGDRIWAGTGAAAKARVLRSADAGRSWAVSDTPLASGPSAGIYSIAFRDDRHGVVVGGDYMKETEAIDNAAITSDGGATWQLVRGAGLSGFRSVVAHVPGTAATWIAVGPRGADVSTDDGRSWTPVSGALADAISFAPGLPLAWATGARGAIQRLRINAR